MPKTEPIRKMKKSFLKEILSAKGCFLAGLVGFESFVGFEDLVDWVGFSADDLAVLVVAADDPEVFRLVSRVWAVLVVIFVFSAHFVKLFGRKLVVFGRVDFFPAQVFVKQCFFRKFGHKNIIACFRSRLAIIA